MALEKNQHIPKYLIVAGDISEKGQNSPNSIRFIQETQKILGINKGKTFICPGNHDISCEHRDFFHGYLADLGSLCLSDNILFDNKKPVSYQDIKDDDLSIILVNSCYKLDHETSEVNILELRTVLSKCSMKRKVIILHHHLIPEEGNISHISNASAFLELVKEKRVNLVIHGHTHAKTQFGIDGCLICGIGTMSSHLGTSNNYQFGFFDNYLQPYIYRYLPDECDVGGGEKGIWKCIR
jgi:predicted phosphodiesterase